MTFEDELSGRMRETVRPVQADVTELVAGGMARGRKEVRRRRLTQLAAGGATCAVLAGVAVLVPWQGNGSNNHPGGNFTVAGPSKPSAKPRTDPAGKPPIAPTPANKLSGDQALGILKSLLPEGIPTDQHRTDDPTGSGKTGSGKTFKGNGDTTSVFLRYQDPEGSSQMYLRVRRGPKQADPNQDRCPVLGKNEGTCSELPRVNGSRIWLTKGFDYSGGRGLKVWSAQVLRSDGLRVFMYETNSATEKGATSRENPPLTAEQLVAIVTSPEWTK